MFALYRRSLARTLVFKLENEPRPGFRKTQFCLGVRKFSTDVFHRIKQRSSNTREQKPFYTTLRTVRGAERGHPGPRTVRIERVALGGNVVVVDVLQRNQAVLTYRREPNGTKTSVERNQCRKEGVLKQVDSNLEYIFNTCDVDTCTKA